LKKKKDCEEKFKKYDKDNSGTISKDELRSILEEKFGGKLKGGLFERLLEMNWSQGDPNNDGNITLEEFYNIYSDIFNNKMTGGFKKGIR